MGRFKNNTVAYNIQWHRNTALYIIYSVSWDLSAVPADSDRYRTGPNLFELAPS